MPNQVISIAAAVAIGARVMHASENHGAFSAQNGGYLGYPPIPNGAVFDAHYAALPYPLVPPVMPPSLHTHPISEMSHQQNNPVIPMTSASSFQANPMKQAERWELNAVGSVQNQNYPVQPPKPPAQPKKKSNKRLKSRQFAHFRNTHEKKLITEIEDEMKQGCRMQARLRRGLSWVAKRGGFKAFDLTASEDEILTEHGLSDMTKIYESKDPLTFVRLFELIGGKPNGKRWKQWFGYGDYRELSEDEENGDRQFIDEMKKRNWDWKKKQEYQPDESKRKHHQCGDCDTPKNDLNRPIRRRRLPRDDPTFGMVFRDQMRDFFELRDISEEMDGYHLYTCVLYYMLDWKFWFDPDILAAQSLADLEEELEDSLEYIKDTYNPQITSEVVDQMIGEIGSDQRKRFFGELHSRDHLKKAKEETIPRLERIFAYEFPRSE